MKAKKRLLYFPLNVSLSILVFSELFLLIGPLYYNITNYTLLYFYLAVLNIAFYYGYKKGIKSSESSAFSFSKSLLSFILIAGLILTIRRMIHMWSGRGLEIAVYSLLYAIQNSGDVYHNAVELEKSSLIWIVLEPLRWAAIPLGIANWRKISKRLKYVVILTIVVEILAWLGIGTRKGLFDVMIIAFFLSVAASPQLITKDSNRKKLFIFVAIGLFVFLSYFVISGASRSGYNANEINMIAITKEIKPSYKDLPEGILYPLSSIEFYLSQGYYSLAKGMELGIRPITFGGSGWYTIMLMNKFGYDPEPDTYIAAVEQFGIDRHVNWHTIYLWLASDLTFWGVPLFIFLIGYLFAISWKDVLTGKNQVAIPFFTLMLIMVFYFYANNQIMSFSFIPLLFWTVFYLRTRLKIESRY